MSMTTTMAYPPQTHDHTAHVTKPTNPLAHEVAACVRRHVAGDGNAMADLTRLVTPWLHRVVRGFRLPKEAVEDVVQSTLLMALLHIDDLREPTAGLSWLSVVARREALRVIRAEARYVAVDEPDSLYPPTAAAGPEEIVLAGLSRDLVRRTVSKLPPRHRVLLERTVIADRPSYATISAELQMPLGSIGPTRRRGLERVRRMLAADPEWDTEESA